MMNELGGNINVAFQKLSAKRITNAASGCLVIITRSCVEERMTAIGYDSGAVTLVRSIFDHTCVSYAGPDRRAGSFLLVLWESLRFFSDSRYIHDK
jgi:hypothetical protein